jgi:hypothetical protein
MARVTCRTVGCPAEGRTTEIALTFTSTEGTFPVEAVVCGACGQPITEIVDDEREAME